MFGRPDYIITLETRDLASYEDLYQNELEHLRELAQIESHIPMRVLRDRTDVDAVSVPASSAVSRRSILDGAARRPARRQETRE